MLTLFTKLMLGHTPGVDLLLSKARSWESGTGGGLQLVTIYLANDTGQHLRI